MSYSDIGRRRVIQSIGTVVASTQIVGSVTSREDLESHEVLLQGSSNSPITQGEIRDAQNDSSIRTSESSSDTIDLPDINPGSVEKIVAYSQTIGDDGAPEVYTGSVIDPEDESVYQSANSQEIEERHTRAKENLKSIQINSTSGFINYDEEWSRTFRNTYDSGICPYGTMTSVFESYTQTDINQDNRALVTRSLTYPGASDECGENYFGGEVSFTHDWSDNDTGVGSPTITDRDAEEGEDNTNGSISLSYAGAGISVPLSGPSTSVSDNSTSQYTDWLYTGHADSESSIHTTASMAEWDYLPGDSQYVSISNGFSVHECGYVVPIWGCQDKTHYSMDTNINLHTG